MFKIRDDQQVWRRLQGCSEYIATGIKKNYCSIITFYKYADSQRPSDMYYQI